MPDVIDEPPEDVVYGCLHGSLVGHREDPLPGITRADWDRAVARCQAIMAEATDEEFRDIYASEKTDNS